MECHITRLTFNYRWKFQMVNRYIYPNYQYQLTNNKLLVSANIFNKFYLREIGMVVL